MNSKFVLPAIATLLILVLAVSSTAPVLAAVVRPSIGPKLQVVTIAEDDQKREKGIIVLGMTPTGAWPKPRQPGIDLLSQHKLLVTFNGQPLFWNVQDVGVTIVCNVLEKDKVQPIPDKLGKPTSQFPQENLVTKLIDVSDLFVCKARWKEVAPGVLESAGVLDVYYIGPALGTVIADNILVVEAFLTIGRAVVVGTDIQDICVLGWSMGDNHMAITKPDGGDVHDTWDNPLGPFSSCEEAALWQRDALGVLIQGFEQ